jgi:hypothetical protein
VESPLDPETILGWYREVNPLDPKLMEAALCVAAAYFADWAWLSGVAGSARVEDIPEEATGCDPEMGTLTARRGNADLVACGGRSGWRAKDHRAAFIKG